MFFSNKQGHKLYISDFLSEVWGKGHCLIANVNYSTAGYVAGYVNKKLNAEQTKFKNFQLQREAEFSCCSSKPGIGFNHMEKYGEQYLQHGFVKNPKKRKQSIPRYYLKKLKEKYPELYREYLVKKHELISKNMSDKDVLAYRHKVNQLKHKTNTRNKI